MSNDSLSPLVIFVVGGSLSLEMAVIFARYASAEVYSRPWPNVQVFGRACLRLFKPQVSITCGSVGLLVGNGREGHLFLHDEKTGTSQDK